MKLIASTTSPFARKVRIVLAEKNIPCEFIVDIPWNADTDVPKFNPLGKVPVLVRDGGDTVYDSRVIVEYLEQLKPWPMMVPAEAEALLAVKKWEALADGVSDAAAAIFIERKRPAAQQSQDWIARQMGKIENGLAAMNTTVEGPFCMGGTFTLADIAVGSTLGYLDLRFAEISWRSRFPALAALAERLSTRPSFVETLPAG
ncbi:MAG: glutathione S-transferase family protein [Moraxellaceae bacterium]|jgi:glutathione S-transferase|nr:glutathione S-transferase family protein [Moraxellaceae bacterium]